MKKCSILYTNNSTGEKYWSESCDEHGATYARVPKTSDIPENHQATAFYGKNRQKQAQKRIQADLKYHMWPHMCTAEIIEFEAEPNWYFEIWHVLQNQYNDGTFQEVRRGFKLNPEITYEIRQNHKRPLIHDLPLDELERYYEWRKTHYKGKIKNI